LRAARTEAAALRAVLASGRDAKAVRAWQNTPPDSLKVDQAPDYRFTL